MYPYPPGEGPMAAIEAAQAEQAAVSTASATGDDGSATPSLSEPRAPSDAGAAPGDVDTERSIQGETAEASEGATPPDAPAQQRAMRAVRAPVSLAGSPYLGAKQAMQLERDIDARLASMGVKIEPLEQRPRPAQMPYAAPGPIPGRAPQGLYVGSGPAFLPPDGDYPGGSTGALPVLPPRPRNSGRVGRGREQSRCAACRDGGLKHVRVSRQGGGGGRKTMIPQMLYNDSVCHNVRYSDGRVPSVRDRLWSAAIPWHPFSHAGGGRGGAHGDHKLAAAAGAAGQARPGGEGGAWRTQGAASRLWTDCWCGWMYPDSA